MSHRLLAALIVGSIATQAIPGIRPEVTSVLIIGAAALALLQFGRGEGRAKPDAAMARVFVSRWVPVVASTLVVVGAVGEGLLPLFPRVSLAAVGVLIALIGAGVSESVSERGGADQSPRPTGAGAATTLAAFLCWLAAVESSDRQRLFLLLACATLVGSRAVIPPKRGDT